MKRVSINDHYKQYMDGKISLKNFEEKIFKTVADSPGSYGLEQWNSDDYKDFVSWLYPRIRKAANFYVDTGSSFEAYLSRIIKISAREYRSRKTTRGITEYAAWTAKIPEMYTHQEDIDFLGYVRENNSGFEKIKKTALFRKQAKNPRQLLILILKCYCYVSDDFLERAAPMTGVTKEKLKELLLKMRELRAKRDEQIRDLRERVHCQFYRCVVYEKRLQYTTENSFNAQKLENQLKKARIRLESMRRRLSGKKTTATNGEVASIMGISKGSVDASLYHIKARWNGIILN